MKVSTFLFQPVEDKAVSLDFLTFAWPAIPKGVQKVCLSPFINPLAIKDADEAVRNATCALHWEEAMPLIAECRLQL